MTPVSPPPTHPASTTVRRPSRLAGALEAARTVDLVQLALGWLRANPFLLAAIALMIPIGIGLDHRLAWLNGPPEWRWIYKQIFDFWPTFIKGLLGIAAGLIVIGFPLICLYDRASSRALRRALAFAGLLFFGCFYHWLGYAVATPAGVNHWGRIVTDPETTGYFTVAQRIESGELPHLRETLRRYPELLRSFPQHPSTHPPGPVLASYAALKIVKSHPAFFDAAGRVFEWFGLDHTGFRHRVSREDAIAAFCLSLALILAAVAAALPFYALVRAALAPAPEASAVAWSAAALWTCYPALMIFEPVIDQAFPALVLLCLYSAVRGLRDRPALWGAAVGFTFMLSISFSFVLLFLVPMLALLAVFELARQAGSWRPAAIIDRARPARPEGRRLWVLIGSTVVTCFAIDALLRGIWGIRLLENFIEASRWQRIAHLPRVNRHYHIWLFYNVYDFLFFAGAPLAVLALAWCVRIERALHRSIAPLTPAWALFPATVFILNVSGLTPAETSRIWLFLAPGVVWAGAAELARRSGERWRANLVVILLAQAAFYFLCRTKMEFIGW